MRSGKSSGSAEPEHGRPTRRLQRTWSSLKFGATPLNAKTLGGAAMAGDPNQLKQDAEWLRMCLEWGIWSKADVIAWADRQVESTDHPDPSIIDVAMATNVGPQDVLGLLRAVPGQAEAAIVRARFFRELAGIIRNEPPAGSRVARILRSMAINGEAPDARTAAQMSCFDDDFELIQYAGRDEGEIRERLLAFLDAHS